MHVGVFLCVRWCLFACGSELVLVSGRGTDTLTFATVSVFMQMPEWAYARTKPSGCPQFARRILSNILYTLYLLLLSSLLIALARLFCFASLSKTRASHFLFKISLHTHTGHPPRTFLSLQVSPKQTSAEDFTSI